MAAKSAAVIVGANPPMKIWAWAPGTVSTSRVAAGAGGGVWFAAGTGPAGTAPNRRSTSASTSAAFTLPLTASTMPDGT